jgi:dihydropteroate synthase
MGIINATPDSFSGDGLLDDAGRARESREGAAGHDADGAGSEALAARGLEQARLMLAEGADMLDIGGESTRPGHAAVGTGAESERVLGVVSAIRAVFPDAVLSIDTTKPEVAEGCLDAGADVINDVAGTREADAMARLAARRGVPYVISHAWPEPRPGPALPDVVAELARAAARAVALGCDPRSVILDPGFGFGKTPEQNLELLRGLGEIRGLGHAVLLGTSRKSTIGRVLRLPPDERLEGTLATTALGIAAGCDIVRVHDVLPNVRAVRMADAVVRGWTEPDPR